MIYKVRVRLKKSSIVYDGLFSRGYHAFAKEIKIEADSALEAKFLAESQYGNGCCQTFPTPIDTEIKLLDQ